MRRYLLFFTLFLAGLSVHAQELNCQVTINTPKLQTADPALFKTLENQLNDFMNNKKWTNYDIKPDERIDCKINITITEEVSMNQFNATANIQSSRPVYNSDYKSVILNYSDKNFNFKYTQYQPIEFNENAFLNNLSSMLGYYAYVIIGLDFDTFKKGAGIPFFQKAKTIVNQAQTSEFKGWKAFESLRNRYWLVDNLLDSKFSKYHDAMFEYHFNGLDKMYENRSEATDNVITALQTLENVDQENPNSMIMQLFINAKEDEVIKIFKDANPQQKTKAVNILSKMDPANTSKYQAILK